MSKDTSLEPRTFEARISIDGGPLRHVVVTSLGAFYVDGEAVASDHPVVRAVRQWPATPEWVVSQPELPRGIDVQTPVPIELTWTGYVPWRPPKDHGSVPLAAPPRIAGASLALWDDKALSAEQIRAHYEAATSPE